MKVLLSWLREFAPGIGGRPEELSDALSSLGLAVEDMTVTGALAESIVVGRVLGLRPHPQADRIQLVDVDDGSTEPLQVCCGAFNMSVGDLVPVARVGTVMPDGMEIARRRMRGQASEGMCCSEAELELGDDAEGIMILNDRVSADAAAGVPLASALGLAPDVCWDLDVGANRPDAMSVMGVARDLAAACGVDFEPPDWFEARRGVHSADLASVEIADPTLCGRFCALVLRDVVVGASPPWLVNRLTALGMRPVNNIVDISNYVMLELGQPSHAFDLARVSGRRLRVRRALQGERIVTLDGTARTLVAGDGVIADGDDAVIGVAGIMGGASSEISHDTTEVLVEMAWWDPPSISRTAKRLNLSSEAATRFRRGTDWGENMLRCMNRFAMLAAQSGAQPGASVIDERGGLPERTALRVRSAKVNSLLGTALSAQEMARLLRSIGFGASVLTGSRRPSAEMPPGAAEPRGDDELEVAKTAGAVDEEMEVTVPTWRWDTETATDVAEEVARLHGYDRIERTVPTSDEAGGLSAYQKDRRLVRDVLVGAGCDEIQPMPFVAPGALGAVGLPEDGITLSNPVDESQSVLRTSLLPGHLDAVAYNQRHFNSGLRFFEIGNVFLAPPSGRLLPDEREHLGVALAEEAAPAAVAVLDVLCEALALPALEVRAASAAGMHPTRCAEVVIAGRVRGFVGEVDPAVLEARGVSGRLAWLQLDLSEVLNGPRTRRRHRPASRYPPSDVDLAFAVRADVAAAQLERVLRAAAGETLTAISLFDAYSGPGLAEGLRSLAYRLRFQASDRTLTDEEVSESRRRCIDAAESRLGVSLRS